jgi:beta-lactamase class D
MTYQTSATKVRRLTKDEAGELVKQHLIEWCERELRDETITNHSRDVWVTTLEKVRRIGGWDEAVDYVTKKAYGNHQLMLLDLLAALVEEGLP